MTWAQITDTLEGGNGSLELRLSIEGFDYDFVTSQEMANLSTMPRRINGLLRNGIKISQEIQFPDMKLKLNSNNFTVVDYQEKATEAFYRKPNVRIYLMEEISPNDTVLTVSSVEGIQPGDYLWIGTECIKVLLVSSTDKNTLIVLRAQLNTTGQSYYTVNNLGTPIRPVIQNVPFTIERKRAFLYAYGKGDDLQGTGTLIWRGIVLNQPRAEATKYTFEVGPITEILKSEIGIDSDELKLRGIYFGAYKWIIGLSYIDFSSGLSTVGETQVEASGFYESKFDLAKDLDAKIKDAVTAAGWTDVQAGCFISADENQEILFYNKNATIASRNVLYSTIASPWNKQDTTGRYDYFNIEQIVYRIIERGSVAPNLMPYVATGTDQFGTTYVYAMKPKIAFPNQMTIYKNDFPKSSEEYGISVVAGVDPSISKRLYLSTAITTFANNIIISNSDGSEVATNLLNSKNQYTPLEYYQSNNFIVPTLKFTDSRDGIAFMVVDNNYKITLLSDFNTNYSYPATDLASFILILLKYSPYNTSNGLLPLITPNDIVLNNISLNSASKTSKQFQTNRKYLFAKKSKKLEDILAEEFKILGVFPTLTEDGKITVRALKNISAFDNPDYTLDSDDIITDSGYPNIETNKYGIWNSVIVRNGYNPITEKYDGVSIIQNNIESISIYGRSKQIEIAPVSRTQFSINAVTPDIISDFETILNQVTSLFAKDYWVVNLQVPIKYFYMNIGSVVRIKNKQLPNYTPNFSFLTSRRGSGRILGTLVGKSFDLDKGSGTISILVSDKEFSADEHGQTALYSPGFVSTGPASLIDTNVYVFATNLLYTSDPSFLAFGFNFSSSYMTTLLTSGSAIRIDCFPTELSTTQTVDSGYGIITNVGSYDATALAAVTISFASPGTLPAAITQSNYIHVVRFADSNYIDTSTDQKKYCYFGDGFTGTNNMNYPYRFNRILGF